MIYWLIYSLQTIWFLSIVSHVFLFLAVRTQVENFLFLDALDWSDAMKSLLFCFGCFLGCSSHFKLDDGTVYFFVLHFLLVLFAPSLLNCRTVVDVLIGQYYVLPSNLVEAHGFKKGSEIDGIDKVAHGTDKDERVDEEVDFALLLVFFPAMIFFKLDSSIKVKVFGFRLDFFWKHLHIVLFSRVSLLQHIVRLFDW